MSFLELSTPAISISPSAVKTISSVEVAILESTLTPTLISIKAISILTAMV
jgi:hypothetical protein